MTAIVVLGLPLLVAFLLPLLDRRSRPPAVVEASGEADASNDQPSDQSSDHSGAG